MTSPAQGLHQQLSDEVNPGELDAMVTMYTTTWCGYCVRLKAGLQREGIDFIEVNIETDDSAADLVMQVNGGNRTVPTVVLPNGSALTNPTVTQIKAELAA